VSVRLVSSGAQITRGIGEALGRVATAPLALLLVGDYGTGKTTFVQGLAAGLGIDGPVRSPSYNIMKVYTTGRILLVHADLYRTNSMPEIEELGLAEVAGPGGLIAVEWPGRYMAPVKQMPSLSVNFSFPPSVPGQEEEPNRRHLEFNWSDDCPRGVQEVLRALAAR
jgi:tRNA threonylcarbamoyl adenosine modification protein YjeE